MQKHYLEPIITGIEKKLVDPAEKDLAALVWKKLATVMGFKVDKHILSACYFVIQSVNTVNRDTADLQKL